MKQKERYVDKVEKEMIRQNKPIIDLESTKSDTDTINDVIKSMKDQNIIKNQSDCNTENLGIVEKIPYYKVTCNTQVREKPYKMVVIGHPIK